MATKKERINVDELTPQQLFVIEKYALYQPPSSIYKEMLAEFGEYGAISAQAIKDMRDKYRVLIINKRNELSSKIPLLDSKSRWGYLQEIIDGALAGDVVNNPNGTSSVKVDRTVALNALKLAQDMTNVNGGVNTEDDELIKSIVSETYEELKAANPEMSDADILEQIVETLGEKVRPFANVENLYVN